MTDLIRTLPADSIDPAAIGATIDGHVACFALDPTDTRRCALAKDHDGPHGWEAEPEAEAVVTLATAMAPTGTALDDLAVMLARLILKRLHALGWDVVRR